MSDETPPAAPAVDDPLIPPPEKVREAIDAGVAPPAPPPPVPMAPTTRGERVATIDIIRGLALFGILAANIRGFAGPAVTYFMPERYWPQLHDRIAQAFVDAFIQGKFITIFAFLFGVGFAVQLDRAEERGSRFGSYYWRRAGILALIGLAHGLLVWFGDILLVYAITVLFLLLFRKRADRTLVSWGVVLYLFPLAVMSLGYFATLAGGGSSMMGPPVTDQILAEQTRIFSSGSWSELQSQRMKDAVAHNWAYFPFMAENILGLFLFGVLAWRKRFFHPSPESLPLYRRAAVAGLVLGAAGNVTSVVTMWVFGVRPFPPTGIGMLVQLLQTFAVPALSLGYVCSVIVLCQSELWKERLASFGAVGRMALSNYLLQSIVGTFVFYSYGLGYFGKAGPALLLVPTIAFFALQVVFSKWWLERFRFGPAEWLWRSLTYGKLQPMRRETAPSVAPDAA